MHNLETIYRKMRMNAHVLDAEITIVVKDLDQRLSAVEEKLDETTRLEKPKSTRRRSSTVSEEEVSSK